MAEEDKEIAIRIENLHKSFKVGSNMVEVLRGINLEVYCEEFLVIFGPSGCGKSTLLNIILGIDTPTSGQVEVRDTNIFKLNEDRRGCFRISEIGMVYQMSYWVKTLNVRENTALPLIVKGIKSKVALKRADKMLLSLKADELKYQIPTELSGGEQQKVGLARALVTNPGIILADEPTGNLDSESAHEIMRILEELNKKHKRTVILVTHNEDYWDYGKRRIEMKDGQIIKDTDHGSKISR